MMKIYLDMLFICNFSVTLLLIEILSRLTKTVLRFRRKAFSALFGGLSSFIVILSPEGFEEALLLVIIKLSVLCLSVLIAFGKTNTKRFIRNVLYFLGMNILLGGACLFASDTVLYNNVKLINCTIYINLSLPLLIISVIAVYLILTVYDMAVRRIISNTDTYTISFSFGDYSITLPAISDTGNRLTDSFSGEPVIVFSSRRMYNHFELDNVLNFPAGGFHIIPYSTVSGSELIPVTLKGDIVINTRNKGSKPVMCAAGIVDTNENDIAIFNPILLM